jgi:hypothetical protein
VQYSTGYINKTCSMALYVYCYAGDSTVMLDKILQPRGKGENR